VSKKSVLVLGHTGMLGSTVAKYLAASGHDVVTTPVRFGPMLAIRPLLMPTSVDVVVNCIGAIPQRGPTPLEMLELNGLLPHALRHIFPASTLLIHASTDCVFSGHQGCYAENDPPDATDDYGVSKAFGDKVELYDNTVVLRTSIIGPAATPHGLMQWLLGQPRGATVKGYTRARWNGVTTLEWAKVADEVIVGWEPHGIGVVCHVASAGALTKYSLLMRIAELWRPDLSIEKADLPNPPRDMRLVAVGPYARRPIEAQLIELRSWMLDGAHK